MDKAVSSVTTAVESAKIKVRIEKSAKLICTLGMTILFTILQSNEVYGFVSKDLEEVSSHANTMVKSSSMTIKKTLEVRKRLCDKSFSIATIYVFFREIN